MALMNQNKGIVNRISGPVVEGIGMENARLHNMVRVGENKLVGEIIRLQQNRPPSRSMKILPGCALANRSRKPGSRWLRNLGQG